jgi:hypothetical protein
MTTTLRKSVAVLLVAASAVGCLFIDEAIWHGGALVSEAEARIGRPLTPMSYAGVARRTTRRAVAVGAATSGCVQVVDVYGRIVTRCY